MAREKWWKCNQMKSGVQLRACEYRLCDECFEKNEIALHQLWKERPDLPGARQKTTPPKTSTTKTSNSTTKAPKPIAALHPEHNIASPRAVNKPISASQPASKVTRGSAKNKNKKADELGCDLLSQKALTDTPLEASQPPCPVCKQSTSTDTIQVTALRCCLCDIYIHGRCLDIKNPSLLDFLYVVSEVGGWCCPGCRSPKNNVKTASDNKKTIKKTISAEQVNDELQFIKTQLASLTDALAPNLDRADPPAPSTKPTFSQVLQSNTSPSQPRLQTSTSSLLNNNLRTAVLTAVHTELNSKSKRSCNVVVSGLQPSAISSVGEQFRELCSYHFNLQPQIRSTYRLGDPTSGKTQPLLVSLESPDDVESLIRVAKNLRMSTNHHVRDNIFINRHLTKTEAAAAFNARCLRRQKEVAAARTNSHQDQNTTDKVRVTRPSSPAASVSMLSTSAVSFVPSSGPVQDSRSSTPTTTTIEPTPAPSSSTTPQWQPSNTEAHPAILFNARSLKNKLPELHQLIYSGDKLSLIFITESWLNQSVTNAMLDPLHQYNIYRCDRSDRTGGGVCAMVPASIKSNEHHLNDEERKLLLVSGCEAVCIDTQLELSRYRFIIIYRPPSTHTDVHDRSINLSNIIAKLTHPQYSTIIAGDFNLPKTNWHANKYPNDGLHDVMYDCFSSLCFVQFVEEATHVTCNGPNNILDLVFCNDPVGLDIDSIEAPISNSDHNLIKFSVFSSSIRLSHDPNDTCINLTSYDWSKANYEAINETLLTIDWHSIFGYLFESRYFVVWV